jgi:hypothetical protein
MGDNHFEVFLLSPREVVYEHPLQISGELFSPDFITGTLAQRLEPYYLRHAEHVAKGSGSTNVFTVHRNRPSCFVEASSFRERDFRSLLDANIIPALECLSEGKNPFSLV